MNKSFRDDLIAKGWTVDAAGDIAFFYMRRHAAQFAKELRAHKLNACPRRGKMTIHYEPRRSKA